MTKRKITVIGSGAWGTALALHCARIGHSVELLCRPGETFEGLISHNQNKKYLPGFSLEQIQISSHPQILQNAHLVLWIVPTQKTPAYLHELKDYFPKDCPVIIGSKGILLNSQSHKFQFPADIFKGLLSNPTAILSGPNFAKEVARGLPTATTIASSSKDTALYARETLKSEAFRIYINEDITGVQVAGALKNVVAIACGISKGMAFGENAQAALITRGLNEIRRVGEALGAHSQTFLGLAGVGDLALTCSSPQSRNFQFGQYLGKDVSPKRALGLCGGVVEGYDTLKAAHFLGKELNVHMPLTQCLHGLIHGGVSLKASLQTLLENQSEIEDV
jgi:glycerol-3-phosphate dehydrogenase (NAD(P)+)